MRKLIVENLRCFHGYHELELRPLTFLVGENSTGKSTILAALRTAESLDRAPEASLNEEPFNLGAFDDIASHAPGRAGRAKFFRIGLEGNLAEPSGPGDPAERPWKVLATFTSRDGQPLVTELLIEHGRTLLSVTKTVHGLSLSLVSGANGRGEAIEASAREMSGDMPLELSILGYLLPASLRRSHAFTEPFPAEMIRKVERFVYPLIYRRRPRPPYAIAPVRTKPKRTYDPKTEIRGPEGDHVPMVLARSYAGRSGESKAVRQRLLEFGVESGLYRDLKVHRFGKTASGPFQVRVKVAGLDANLIDVGYGVSQVLPILVDALESPRRSTFLMQQPEVHLHPRAQAALGSFLAKLAKEDGKRFVVETHSDYIIDRVRLDIRDGVNGLRAGDVAILFFERNGPWVTIHPIRLDERGNVVEAPDTYRSFFMEEQARLFGV